MLKREELKKVKSGNKKKSKKNMLFIFAVLVFMGYVCVSLVQLQIDISLKKKELADYDQKIEQQQLKNDELSAIVDAGDNAEYIERIAREKLGLAAPDEHVYIDISGN